MTLIAFDGFENYSTMAQYGQVWVPKTDAGFGFPATSGYNNSRCIQMSAYGSGQGPTIWNMARQFQSSRTVTAGIAIKFTPTTASGYNNLNPIIEFSNGTNINISVYLRNASISPTLTPKYYPLFAKSYNYSSGTFIATGNMLKNYDVFAWHYYELELDCSTNGFARFYVDGNKVLELTNYDFSSATTSVQATNTFKTYGGVWQSPTTSTETYFDNFYLTDDTTRLGHMTFNTLRPTADTDQRDWLPSTGTVNYDLVNDPGSQTTNSLSTIVNDATDLYVMSDLTPPTSVSSILAIKQNMIATKTRFGDTAISGLVKYGNNSINFPAAMLTESTYTMYQNPMDTNPVTNQRWAPSDLNNMQIGMTSHLQTNIILKSINNLFFTTVPGTALVTSDTPPTLSNGAAIFSSGNVVRFSDAPGWHITSPWSVEFEFYTSAQNVEQCIFNIGGSSTTYPEFNIMINSDNSVTSSVNSNNAAGGQQTGTYFTAGQLQMNKWYRIGAMVYTVGGVNRLRGYINGYQKFDMAITLPYDATKGVSVGNDYDALPAKQFLGGIRNFSVGNSQYWIGYNPSYNNVVFSISNGLVTNSSGSTLVAGDTAPVTSGNALTFNGSQRIRYTDGAAFRVISPYSVEFDFQTTNPNSQQILFNIGGDLNLQYPELMINITTTGGLMCWTNPNNANPNQSAVLAPSGSITSSTWYRIGVMIYMSGPDVHIRGYFNGLQAFDQVITQPRDSTGGFSLGASLGTGSYLTGSIRRLAVGQSLFWNI